MIAQTIVVSFSPSRWIPVIFLAVLDSVVLHPTTDEARSEIDSSVETLRQERYVKVVVVVVGVVVI